jgi:hypothetical protein
MSLKNYGKEEKVALAPCHANLKISPILPWYQSRLFFFARVLQGGIS